MEGYTSVYSKCDFQIFHAKIFQNINFQLTSSRDFENSDNFGIAKDVANCHVGKKWLFDQQFSMTNISGSTYQKKVKFGLVIQHLRENLHTKFQPFLRVFFPCNDPTT